MKRVIQTLRSKKGQGMVEYALILTLIAIVVIAAFQAVAAKTNAKMNAVATALNNG